MRLCDRAFALMICAFMQPAKVASTLDRALPEEHFANTGAGEDGPVGLGP